MYSQHALQRMQQRGTLLTFGCSHYYKGREVVFLDHYSLAQPDRSGE